MKEVILLDHSSDNNAADQREFPPGFSVGAKLTSAKIARYICVGDGIDEWTGSAFKNALEEIPNPHTDSWICQGMKGNYRKANNFACAWYIPTDLDYLNADGEHSEIPDSAKAQVESAIENRLLPGNLCHFTRRGARVYTLVSKSITNPVQYRRACIGAANLIRKALADAGIAVGDEKEIRDGLAIDKSATRVAQVMRTPRCTVPNEPEPRNAPVVVLREEPYTVEELVAAAGDDDGDDNPDGGGDDGGPNDGPRDTSRYELDDGAYWVDVKKVSPRKACVTFIVNDAEDGFVAHRNLLDLNSDAQRKKFVSAIKHKVDGIDLDELADALLEIAAREDYEDDGEGSSGGIEYTATPKGLCAVKHTQHGPVKTVLSNFRAEIVKDVLVDDGVEKTRMFTIKAEVGGVTSFLDIPAKDFASLNWVIEHLGAIAAIAPGTGNRELLRAAIQATSVNIESRTTCSHTGWVTWNDKPIYLHGGGAIGADGNVDGIDVCLNGSLKHYELSPPPTAEELRKHIAALSTILRVAPKSVMFPLLGAAFRATLGGCDFSLHLHGQTGARKSELAALAQRFFGKEMDRENLPQNWSSTANAIEGACFYGKDSLTVIDDFAPGEDALEARKLHQKADRVFRNQGNGAGRNRMFADGTLRPPKPPRSLPLSTGEEVPGGSSCRARLVLIEVKPGDVNLEALTKAQHQAASGVYASVMAGFIQWLAPRLDEQRERLKTVIDEWRAMNGMPHGRTAGNLAQLFFGIDLFLTFAVEVGAIPETKAATIKGNAKLALIELARRQSDHLRDSCPAQRFLELIAASLASYDAHVATTDGTIPTAERAWGWRQCEGQGRRIGWIDGDYVLLDPTASYAVAQDAARRLGESIGIKPATLWARLRDKGVLAETDETRERVKVRKTIACLQRRVEVLILRVADIVSIDPSACEKRADAPMFVIKGGTRDLTDEELIEMSELKDEMTTQGEQSCA